MCTDKIYTVDKRMMDLLLRHGVYKNTHYHIKETYKLKEYFDNLLGYNLYDLFPEIKEEFLFISVSISSNYSCRLSM